MENTNNKEEVFLRIYEITNGMAKIISKQLLGFQIDGVWHTSIEIYGKEFYFQNTVNIEKPGNTPFGQCIERKFLGFTNCNEKDFLDFFNGGKSMWNADTYDLFDNNCNHFTNWMCNFLLDKNIPEYILNLPERVKKTEFFKLFIKQNYKKDFEDLN